MVADSRRGKRHIQDEVHADYGLWRQEWNGDRIEGYVGRFPKGDHATEAFDHAEGLAWFLAVSNTTPRPRGIRDDAGAVAEQSAMIAALQRKDRHRGEKIPKGWYYPPEENPDAFIVRIDRDRARLDKFERFAYDHDFLPDWKRAQEEKGERQATLKAWRNVRSAAAINNSLEWKPIGAKESPGLEAVTKDPHMAYALAIYLHNEKYLDGRAFGKLFWQANHAVREEKQTEFHLTIQSDQVEQFREQFPNACSKKTLPGATWAEKTGNGHRSSAKPRRFNWRTDDRVTGLLPFGGDGYLR